MWAIFFSACAPSSPPPVATAPAPAEAPPSTPPRSAPPPPTEPENRPPKILSVSITPDSPTAVDPIEVSFEAEDPEFDPLTPEYKWFVNGEERGTLTGTFLSGGSLEHGDKVYVEVTVTDGTNVLMGRTRTLTVANRPPVIDEDCLRPPYIDGFQLLATDPDDDSLSWRLEGAPPEMSISSSGMLRYQPSRDAPAGSWKVGAIVEDGHGGWARLDLPVSVSAGSNAGRAP